MSRTTPITSLHGSGILRRLATGAAVAAVAAPSAAAVALPVDGAPGDSPRTVVVAAPNGSTGVQWTQVGASAGAGALIVTAIGAGLVGTRRVHIPRSVT